MGSKRVVIITGASSGIGLALAERAARGGFDVVAVGRRSERLERLRDDVDGAIGEVLTIATDVTETGAAQAIARAALERFGRIDILVNNAGGVAVGAIGDQSDHALREQVATHVVAPLALLRETLPSLVERRGHVFFVGSGVARIPVSGLGVYSGAKAAVRNFTRVARTDLRPHGIAVTYIDPGAVATEFMTRAGFAGPPPLLSASPYEVARRIYAAFASRPDVVNGVPWQTAFVAVGELLPGVTDWLLSLAPGIVGGGDGPAPGPQWETPAIAPVATSQQATPPPALATPSTPERPATQAPAKPAPAESAPVERATHVEQAPAEPATPAERATHVEPALVESATHVDFAPSKPATHVDLARSEPATHVDLAPAEPAPAEPAPSESATPVEPALAESATHAELPLVAETPSAPFPRTDAAELAAPSARRTEPLPLAEPQPEPLPVELRAPETPSASIVGATEPDVASMRGEPVPHDSTPLDRSEASPQSIEPPVPESAEASPSRQTSVDPTPPRASSIAESNGVAHSPADQSLPVPELETPARPPEAVSFSIPARARPVSESATPRIDPVPTLAHDDRLPSPLTPEMELDVARLQHDPGALGGRAHDSQATDDDARAHDGSGPHDGSAAIDVSAPHEDDVASDRNGDAPTVESATGPLATPLDHDVAGPGENGSSNGRGQRLEEAQADAPVPSALSALSADGVSLPPLTVPPSPWFEADTAAASSPAVVRSVGDETPLREPVAAVAPPPASVPDAIDPAIDTRVSLATRIGRFFGRRSEMPPATAETDGLASPFVSAPPGPVAPETPDERFAPASPSPYRPPSTQAVVSKPNVEEGRPERLDDTSDDASTSSVAASRAASLEEGVPSNGTDTKLAATDTFSLEPGHVAAAAGPETVDEEQPYFESATAPVAHDAETVMATTQAPAPVAEGPSSGARTPAPVADASAPVSQASPPGAATPAPIAPVPAIATEAPARAAPEPTPVAERPMPIAATPLAPEPEPIAIAPEPIAVAPEPLAAAPESLAPTAPTPTVHEPVPLVADVAPAAALASTLAPDPAIPDVTSVAREPASGGDVSDARHHAADEGGDAAEIWRRPPMTLGAPPAPGEAAHAPEAGPSPWRSQQSPWLPPAVEHAATLASTAVTGPDATVWQSSPAIPAYTGAEPELVIDPVIPDDVERAPDPRRPAAARPQPAPSTAPAPAPAPQNVSTTSAAEALTQTSASTAPPSNAAAPQSPANPHPAPAQQRPLVPQPLAAPHPSSAPADAAEAAASPPSPAPNAPAVTAPSPPAAQDPGPAVAAPQPPQSPPSVPVPVVPPPEGSDVHDDYIAEVVPENATNFERALTTVARRMRKLNLSHHFLARLLVPGDVLFTGDVALRWAGMPNKNERALTAEALHVLADAGYLERLEDERYRVLLSSKE